MDNNKHSVIAEIIRFATILVLIVVGAIVFGLAYFHKQTTIILSTILNIVICLSVAFALYKCIPKCVQIYRELRRSSHERRMQDMEYKKSVADIEHSKAETDSIRIQAYAEYQRATFIHSGISEHVHRWSDTSVEQIVVAQPAIQQRAVPGPAANAKPSMLPQSIPAAPTFANMHQLITDERNIVLGYSSERPFFGTVDRHMLSKIIMGMPGQGKSTALLYDLGVLIKAGTYPFIFDPQGSLKELDGVFPYADSFENMYSVIPNILDELNERDQLWRNGKRTKDPFLFMADELPQIAAYEQSNKISSGILDLIQKLVLEARKYRCYVILSGQSFPADILPTITRDNMSARQVYNTKDRQALTAGLDKQSRAILLPFIEKCGIGVSILDMSVEKEPLVIATPYTEVDDIVDLVKNNEVYQQWAERLTIDSLPTTEKLSQEETKDFVNTYKPEIASVLSETGSFVSQQDKVEEVRRLKMLNFKQGEIIARVWGARPGDNQPYRDAREEYQQILSQL